VDENRNREDVQDELTIRARVSPSDHLLPEESGATVPTGIETEDPDAARARIEQTRARMSETIDEIEGALLQKKARIQDRLDVLSPIRENPLAAVGAVFVGGLLLGLITGGRGRDDEPELGEAAGMMAGAAARQLRRGRDDLEEIWEKRGKTLRKEAKKRRKQLSSFRDDVEDRYEEEGGVGGIAETVAAAIVSGLASLISEVRDRAGDLGEEARDRGEDLYEAVEDEVKDLKHRAKKAASRGRDRLRSYT
jgi:ElaB/YqjD/DUF883 family membrane-anchored ribosome-binding protein